jgi:uncharacterized delta-60 repeat protein
VAAGSPSSIAFVPATGETLVAVGSSVSRLSSTGAIESSELAPYGMQITQILDAGAGQVLAVGFPAGTDTGTQMVRFTAAGGLDPTFGSAGTVFSGVGAPYLSLRRAVITLTGRILLATAVTTGPSSSELGIVAFTRAGALDPTFGQSGMATTVFHGGSASGIGVALQKNGKVVVAGSYSASGGGPVQALVARFLPGGKPDVAFGHGGVFEQVIGGIGDYLQSVVVAPGGNLVVAGMQNTGTDQVGIIAELTPQGALNTSFGSGGAVTENPTVGDTDMFEGVAVTSNNKIYGLLLEGYGPFNASLRRYTSAGLPDQVFGAAGVVRFTNVVPVDVAIAFKGRPDVALERLGSGASSAEVDRLLI